MQIYAVNLKLAKFIPLAHIFTAFMSKMRLRPGLCSRLHWGSFQRFSRTLSWWREDSLANFLLRNLYLVFIPLLQFSAFRVSGCPSQFQFLAMSMGIHLKHPIGLTQPPTPSEMKIKIIIIITLSIYFFAIHVKYTVTK